MSVMEECIPQTTLPSKCNLPWMTPELTKSLRARNLLYKRAKRNNSYRLWHKYKMKRNKVANQLKSAKRKYFSRLKLSDPKMFWKTVKKITKEDSRIPCIEGENEDIISNDESKAFILNDYFSNYMSSLLSLMMIGQPTNTRIPVNSQKICSALRTKFNLLFSLNVTRERSR